MAFTFAAFTYIVALIIDAFLIFFAIFHVSRVCSNLRRVEQKKSIFCRASQSALLHQILENNLNRCSETVIISDNCIWRTKNWLQEPDRPVRQSKPLGIAGIHPPFHLQLPVPDRGGVVQYRPQHPPHGLSCPQISQETSYVRWVKHTNIQKMDHLYV